MQDFRELQVWRKAHELTLAIYHATSEFPKHELYGLTGQIRRCAASVPANLAEGCCRNSDRDFARVVGIALGSASETEYHLLLAKDLDYLQPDYHAVLSQQVEEVKRMLTSLHGRLLCEKR